MGKPSPARQYEKGCATRRVPTKKAALVVNSLSKKLHKLENQTSSRARPRTYRTYRPGVNLEDFLIYELELKSRGALTSQIIIYCVLGWDDQVKGQTRVSLAHLIIFLIIQL